MINIQLFAGPCGGKSATASGLFSEMKIQGYNAEFVQEYAKDLIYEKNYFKLGDQLHILGEQHLRMKRFEDQVDYLIHDSPFLLGLVYLEEDGHLSKKNFEKLAIDLFKTYDNFNIFIERNLSFKFHEEGRKHNLSQSIKKDEEIKNILKLYDIPFHEIKLSKHIVQDILNIIKKD